MTRQDFLARVRHALHRDADEPAEIPPLTLAPLTVWDPADLVEEFVTELTAVGGTLHRVKTIRSARTTLKKLLAELGAESFICSTDAIVEDVLSAINLPLADDPAKADVGITGAAFGIANTGTLVLTSEAGRKASLLPMTHIALLQQEQLVPTMAEALATRAGVMPSAWVQATGPSRTADIELTLTTGVHGPGVVHVVLVGG